MAELLEPYEDIVPKDLAKEICLKARGKTAAQRSIVSSNDKMERKAEKIKLAGRSSTAAFAQLVLLTRRKLHHRGLTLIEPGSNEWFQLKEVCKLACDFCNEFQLPFKPGCIEYLRIGMGKMKNFSLGKFKSMHQAICKDYEAEQEILSDKTPSQTEQLYNLYLAKVNEKVGWEFSDYKSNPEKYVCFIRAKECAAKIGIGVKTYINAQFSTMESIPDPYQLYGDKAIMRVRKYCYENSITIKAAKTIDFSKIKNS